MTLTMLLAGIGGICAAIAISELLGAPARTRPAVGPGGRLGAMTVLLARLARRAGGRTVPADMPARIAAAGNPLGLSAADVGALKGAGAAVGLLLAMPVAGALPGRLGIAVMALAPAAGYLSPEALLARLARARAGRVEAELADVLDLLRIAVEAGLPAGRAMSDVGRRCGGLLAAELGVAATQMQLGATRCDALAALVARCPADGVAALAGAIARADRHGSPLAPALSALAEQARADQARRTRDAAARAAPQIQLVVALVLVPAVMLLIAAVLMAGLQPG